MDELAVLGRIRERVNSGLVHLDPGRNSDFRADFRADFVEAGRRHPTYLQGCE
jgi:hypothetical protein